MGDSLDFAHAEVDVGSLRFFVIAATVCAACFLVAMSYLKEAGSGGMSREGTQQFLALVTTTTAMATPRLQRRRWRSIKVASGQQFELP